MNAVPLAHNVIIRLIKGCKWSEANEAWKCLLLVDIVSFHRHVFIAPPVGCALL
jgi:hypothetical protein